MLFVSVFALHTDVTSGGGEQLVTRAYIVVASLAPQAPWGYHNCTAPRLLTRWRQDGAAEVTTKPSMPTRDGVNTNNTN
jgi:hypothetical protein